ncbi:Tripartite motif-containing protein 2 [Fasciola gigantica]|uniref:Tripartite motif-containing protein 2 n=1 Tax=Fasciola gigantica TaxID=46835 RepID=A0A504YDL0_FASGI|nr:Tripartite motif-containing protein 2 [Fasciola gigantica]
MLCSSNLGNESEFASSAEQLNESRSDTTSISSFAESPQQTVSVETVEIIRQAQEVIKCLTDRCEELERLNETLPILRKEIRSQIDQSMQMIQRKLTERHEFLINELDSSLNSRTEHIVKMRTEFESRLQRLSSHVDLLKRLVQMSPSSASIHNTQKGNPAPPTRAIAVQKHKQEIEKILTFPVPFHPSEYDTMSFFPTELDQLLSMVQCVGAIGLTSIDATMTKLAETPGEDFSPVRRCSVNEEVMLEIVPKDRLGRPVSNPTSKEFTVSMASRVEHLSEVSICDQNDSEKLSSQQSNGSSREYLSTCNTPLYVLCKASTPGAYDLSIKLYGEHIQGSPFLVFARAPCKPDVKSWIDKMHEYSHLPHRIRSVRETRRRCTSAPCNSVKLERIEAYADIYRLHRGDLLQTVGTKGRGDGEFANPTGICVTRENKILVSDSNNACIQVFDSQAQFLFRIGQYGYHPGQLMRPMDVAETINGNYLISDYELHCVTVFNPSGAYISRFGQRYLAGPKGLIADSRGRILVVDQKSCMVCIFKPTGKFINRFGARGVGDHQFTNPISVAVNAQDEIYVSDYAQHSVKVFDFNGLYLFRFGVSGMDLGMLHAPTGLAFDKADNLYISDCGNNRVQMFDAIGNYLRPINSQLEPLNGPQGLTFHNQTNRLLVTDPGNYCIKIYRLGGGEKVNANGVNSNNGKISHNPGQEDDEDECSSTAPSISKSLY